jgi:hypothetical protein
VWLLDHATYDRAGTIDAGYPSTIALPTPGCWRFTADIASANASIVVSVEP